MHQARHERLQRELKRRKIDCAVIVPGPNLRYLTGLCLKPSERITLAFIPLDREPALLLPLLEVPQAEQALKAEAKLYSYGDEEGPDQALSQLVRDLELKGKTLGVELRQMRLLELKQLKRHLADCRRVELDGAMEELRMIKDDSEIRLLRQALELTESVLAKTIRAIRPGVSERAIAQVYQRELLEAGGEGVSFEPIVVSGPNSGSPHASAGERAIQPGDIVTLDCGASWGGYLGDITRNVAMGRLDPELEEIYKIVKEANAAGREACRPGVAVQEVDRAARQVIERAGYGRYFIHRTGHGLGLEVHEPPYIIGGNEQELQPGQVFTVEPGIYLPGKGGVRLEDVMLITTEGAETLTRFPRELIRL